MSEHTSTSAGADSLAELVGQLGGPVEYATVVVTAAVLVLGAYVGYQAYRGYRRNDNRAVLFLGAGLFLATTGRQLASIGALLAVGEVPLVLLSVFFGVSIAGLASVLYAFLGA
ncbi:DUF7521 family protein [Halostella salina]|uniref:DUF7521 family protein n=1 Tax=Halostella salina TaxID=1547897 RepID=UPI000EF8380B|nr:hypothetical protein [Halostella salina]